MPGRHSYARRPARNDARIVGNLKQTFGRTSVGMCACVRAFRSSSPIPSSMQTFRSGDRSSVCGLIGANDMISNREQMFRRCSETLIISIHTASQRSLADMFICPINLHQHSDAGTKPSEVQSRNHNNVRHTPLLLAHGLLHQQSSLTAEI